MSLTHDHVGLFRQVHLVYSEFHIPLLLLKEKSFLFGRGSYPRPNQELSTSSLTFFPSSEQVQFDGEKFKKH
jgi:hypothetical protein